MKAKGKYILICCMVLPAVLMTGVLAYFRISYGSNTLVVYFSRAGNTDFSQEVDAVSSASLRKGHDGELVGNSEVLADDIHDFLGADIYEIQVDELYPEDYEETVNRASEEQNQNARPALTNQVQDMDRYDNVILIYPVWWSTIPMPVYTFLEEYDFREKTVVPIATHKGSFLGESVNDIRTMLPEADVKDGVAISGSSVDYLKYWILGAVIGIIMFFFSIVMLKKHKDNPVKSKIWFIGAVFLLAVSVVSILKLLI